MNPFFGSYFGKGGGGGISPSSSASSTSSAGISTDTSKVINFGSKNAGLGLAVGACSAVAVLALFMAIRRK